MKRSDNKNWYDAGPVAQFSKEPETLMCKACRCQWFEQIAVQRYPKLHNVILGQRVSSIDDAGFWLFRCVKCGEVYEPNVQAGTHDTMRKYYDNFLDDMETPIPNQGK